MRKYKYNGGDKVLVVASTGILSGSGLGDFIGTVVACVSDLAVIGHSYVVVADKPKEAGLQNETYPFPGVVVSELSMFKI